MRPLHFERLEDRTVPTLFPTTTAIPGANFAFPAVAAVGNYNGDAFPDLAVTDDGSTNPNRMTVVFGDPNNPGTFINPLQVTLSASASKLEAEGVVSGNFDGQGNDDVVAVLNQASVNNVLVFRNNTSFPATPSQVLTASTNPTHVTAADLDGDGDQDIAVSNFGGLVSVYFNNGAGVFTQAPGSPFFTGGSGSNVIVAGNFDGKNGNDLAVANQQTNNVSVLLNNGAGSFAAAPGSPMAAGDTGTTFLAVGDLDLDGNLDLVASNTVGGSTIRTFYGNGDGTFTPEATVTVGASPTGVLIRDLNGDQLPDIAVGVSGAGTVAVRMNTGNPRVFQNAPGSPFAAVTGVTWVAAGDFNQDGRPDLAVTQYQSGNNVNVLLNGLIGTTTVMSGPTTVAAGQAVTFTAIVTPAQGGPVNTGFVNFFDNGVFIQNIAVNTNGTAVLIRQLPLGNHSITASYSDVAALTWSGSQSQPLAVTAVTGGGGVVALGRKLVVSGSVSGSPAVFVPVANGQFPATPSAIVSPFAGFTPFPGNVRAISADVNNDGFEDTVLVTGPGTPVRVAVVSGQDNNTVLVPAFDPFGGDFTGGGFVAAGNLDGQPGAEFVVTPDQGGGPRVSIFSFAGAGAAPTLKANFFGIDDPSFRGGARSALGDVNGDGTPDLAVCAGFLGGPRTALFNGTSLFTTPTRIIGDFFAFPGTDATNLRNGVFVAAGDVDGDGRAELIFGGGPGGAPRVFILSGAMVTAGDVAGAQANPIANFFVAGNANDRGGVRLTALDADGDTRADVATGSGEGSPARVRVYLGKDFSGSGEPGTFQDITVFGGQSLTSGVFVG